MTTQMIWYSVTRQAIPGLLVGEERPIGPGASSPDSAIISQGDAIVGYAHDRESEISGTTLKVMLIDDAKRAELLAWLHTYSEESFPISHCCRVQTLSDWRLTSEMDNTNSSSLFSGALASLIVGEMLAQAESDLSLATVPMSWANGCFTLAMHRALRLRNASGKRLTKLVAERLRVCESDARFARRVVSVDALTLMWSLLSEGSLLRASLLEVCMSVVTAVHPVVGEILAANAAIRSKSAEHRVAGFDAIVDEVLGLAKRNAEYKSAAGCLLAAAALLVGGGTSHIELLRPMQEEIPECLGWFGLMAGFVGPTAWDSSWLRLVKGVERQLAMLNLSSSTTGEADLAWLEYEWLASQSPSEMLFLGFPKRNARALSVEIIPGSPCQFLLLSSVDHKVRTARRVVETTSVENNSAVVEKRFREIDKRWEVIMKMVADLNALVVAAKPSAITTAQPELFDNDPKPNKKVAKTRGKSGTRA